MRSRFSKANPPEFVEYQGCKYRLKKAAMPAKQAEQKLEQVERAVSRLDGQGPSADLLSSLKSKWKIDSNNLMDSKGPHGETPHLIMWNPLTDELVLDEWDHYDFHMDLFESIVSGITRYPGARYDDWIRGYVTDDRDEIRHWEWAPLWDYKTYLSPRQQRDVVYLHKKGNGFFKEMLAANGAGKYPVGLARFEDR